MRIILNLLLFTQALFKPTNIFSTASLPKIDIYEDEYFGKEALIKIQENLNNLMITALNPEIKESPEINEQIMIIYENTPLLGAQNFTIRGYETTLLNHALCNFRLNFALKLIQTLPDEIKDSEFDAIAAPSFVHEGPLEYMLKPNLPENERLSVTEALLTRGSSLYLRQTSQFSYKTILQEAIIKNLKPEFFKLLISIGGAHPGYHPDYFANPEELRSPIGLVITKYKRSNKISTLLEVFIQHANINELIPFNTTWNATVLGILSALPTNDSDDAKKDRIEKICLLIAHGAMTKQIDNFGHKASDIASLSDNLYLTSYVENDFLDFLLTFFPRPNPMMRSIRYFLSSIPQLSPLILEITCTVLAGIVLIYAFLPTFNQKTKTQKSIAQIQREPSPQAITQIHKISKKEKDETFPEAKPPEGKLEEDSSSKNENENENKPDEKASSQNKLEILLKTVHDDSKIKQSLMDYDEKQTLDLNSSWGEKDDTLLMHLISGEYFESMKFVIEKMLFQQSSLINEMNNKGQTALMVACQAEKPKIIKYLLNKEKIPNLRTNLHDERGENALFMWLKCTSLPPKQKLSCTKNLLDRGCELTPKACKTWTFISFTPEQQEELKSKYLGDLISASPAPLPVIQLESKQMEAKKTNSSRRKSLDTTKKSEKKDTEVKSNLRRASQPNLLSQPLPTTQHQINYNLLPCIRNCQYLILAFQKTPTSPLEVFCRHADLLLQIIDLAKRINYYTRFIDNNEKTAVKDFIYYIRHCVMPQLLKARLLTSALTDVEEIANELIQWIPGSLKEKKLDEKLVLTESETPLLESLRNFFEAKNSSGLRLNESKLFKNIITFHEKREGVQFAPVIHEDYVKFALPIIDAIYNKISNNLEDKSQTDRHALILILVSCGDAGVKYNNPAQTKEFSYFVSECRRCLRNLLMHSNDSFLDVSEECINYLYGLAKKAINSEAINMQIKWGPYQQEFIKIVKQVTNALSECGLFATRLNSEEPGKKVLDYLGYAFLS